MTTAITKAYRLRTGNGGFDATSADSSDPYIVRVNDQVDHIRVMELFVALAGAPIPKQTLKAFGGSFVVCDRYTCRCVNKQRYLWELIVHWKELEDSQPQDQTSPFPNNNSIDPVDWIPTVTRRPVTVYEPAESMFYEGGYSGMADTLYAADADADPPSRSPLTNSALTPFADNLPPHQRKQSLWTIRWLRPEVPPELIDKELMLNDADLTFSHGGYSEFWEAKTAKIESIQLSQTKWGTLRLWEIVMEILSDFDGHYVTTLDQGLTEAFQVGDPLPESGSPAATEFTRRVIRDGKGQPVSESVLLDGWGKKKGKDAAAVYGKWRDFELTAFGDVPLLGDLIS
jgi:hypothetical protein